MSERIETDGRFYQGLISEKKQIGGITFYQVNQPSGEGMLKSCDVMPGIELIYSEIKLKKPFDHTLKMKRKCLEITYCLEGSIEVEFKDHRYSYIQSGDLSLFNCQSAVKNCSFSEHIFKGFSMIVYPEEAVKSLNQLFETGEFQEEKFLPSIWQAGTCIISHASQNIEHICKEIMTLPEVYRQQHLKLKTSELLLYLWSEQSEIRQETVYFARDLVDKVKVIRRDLVIHPENQMTIDELAEQQHIGRTTLQKCFKEVYGSSIAQYRRQVRMQKAHELLIQSKQPVTEIAGICGYSNMSKFSSAYCKVYGCTPLQYRKQYE